MWLLLVLVLVLSTAAANSGAGAGPCSAAAGRSRSRTRVVGGDAASIKQYPYQVSLEKYRVHLCGGSVVAPQWVLTAAHCVVDAPASSFRVRAGTATRQSGGTVVAVSASKMHPQYKKSSEDFDVALVSLQSALAYSDVIKAAVLPALGSEPSTNAVVTVTGWGFIKAPVQGQAPPPLSTQLQRASLKVVAREVCKKANGSGVTTRMICAGAAGKDACQYDSGGPLTDAAGKQVGVVSWGKGCALQGYPGVYVHLGNADIRTFIKNTAQV